MPTRPATLRQLQPAPVITSGKLSKITGLPQQKIQNLVAEGLPTYALDQRRYVFNADEAVAWLTEHGHLIDPYREHIKKLVDAAPPLTAEQADRIRAVLSGGAA
jgi:phage terminase Nu1 subunit (DNA packaging protein)